MTSNNLSSLRNQLLANGYKILPNRGKIPALPGWNTPDYIARELTDGPKGSAADRVARWGKRFPAALSTGLLICDGLVVIDVDVDEPIVVGQLWQACCEIIPQAMMGPIRYGASADKLAIFCRLDPAEEAFVRIASRRYNGHCVEIFGGRRLKGGNVSRQFGIYGPHSFRDDGTIAAEYHWDQTGPALHEVAAADLPVITVKQVHAIIDAFEGLAVAAGWQAEAAAAAAAAAAEGTAIYDIDDTTRFDTNRGGNQISYEQLCEQYEVYGDGLRCSSNFMPGRGDSGKRDRCLIGSANRHQCVAVWVNNEGTLHFPAALKPPELKPDETLEDVLPPAGSKKEDYLAFLPTHQYIYRASGRLYPLASINTTLNKVTIGTKPKKQTKKQRDDGEPVELVEVQIPASLWLDRHRPIMEMTWLPGAGDLIHNRLPAEGGWIERNGVTTFNDYRPPPVVRGNAVNAGRWLDLVAQIYPDHVDHIVAFFAHRIQRPGEKINHGLVLTGSPGIGKDTLLEPLRQGVGEWNFREISPHDITSNNNDFMKSVVLRVSETRDLGEIDRYKFYEATKSLLAAPPDMVRVNVKYVPQYYVPNLTGVVFTTNYPMDGLFLPPDDRRHYVCGTELARSEAWDAYCLGIWEWYQAGGADDVVVYLADYDLSTFSAKLPPAKTPAFWRMVEANRPAEESEFRDAITKAGDPLAITIATLTLHADYELAKWIRDRANSRNVSRRLDACGYIPVHNVDERAGRWSIGGKQQMIYGRKDATISKRYSAAAKVKRDGDEAYAKLPPEISNVIPIKP